MDSYWFQNGIFYGVDIRRFQDSNGDGFGDIQGLISRLDYVKDLGADALWLLPFFDTPLQDNGYDVRDYYRVDPRVGTLDDFKKLVEEAHKRDIRLVIDLVMNHTSDQHPWFQASRNDRSSRFRDYYIWTDNIPEETLGGDPVFPGVEDSVWAYDQEAKAYYYHRFYHFQPDLHTAHPEVQEEIFKALDFWLAMDVDGFRIDAAPIMLETKGVPATRMEHPHRLLENIHDFSVERKRGVVILGEANVSLDQMDEFFGGGSEMNMLFNFQIGPHIMLAFAEERARPIYNYLLDALDPPANDQWLNFLRHHDEMTLDMMPEKQRQIIFKAFAPDENMRIYNRGIRRRLAPMMANGDADLLRPKLELAYSLMISTPGTPMIFYGDEIGMGDDLSLEERNSVRTPMQWNSEKNGGFSTADELIAPVIDKGPFRYAEVNVERALEDPDSLLHWIRKILAIRKEFPTIGHCHPQVLKTDNDDDRVVVSRYPELKDGQPSKPLLHCHNLSSEALTVTANLPEDKRHMLEPEVILGRGKMVSYDKGKMTFELPAYGYLWVRMG